MRLRNIYGQLLRGYRADRDWTLRETANKAFLSISMVSDVEHGKKEPSSESLQAILGAFDIDMAVFFDEVADYLRKAADEDRNRVHGDAPAFAGHTGA